MFSNSDGPGKNPKALYPVKQFKRNGLPLIAMSLEPSDKHY